MKKLSFLLFSLILLFIVGCSKQEASTEASGNYPNADLLVDVEWAKEHAADEKVVFVDLREEGFEAGHIPGAVNYTWKQIVDKTNSVDGFLVGPEEFTKQMQDLGISNDSIVVAYDDGASSAAGRFFYALEYYGHQQVKVLNGGYMAWLNAGYDVATEAKEISVGDFTAKENTQLRTTKDEVLENLENDAFVFLDTRSKGEYTGEDVRAERGGHIPNAVNLEWKDALAENQDGVTVFKSYDELKAQLENIGVQQDKTVVPYCQTNVRGAHSYFVLRLLGYDNVRPYEGSWAEWGNDPETPIEK